MKKTIFFVYITLLMSPLVLIFGQYEGGVSIFNFLGIAWLICLRFRLADMMPAWMYRYLKALARME